MLPDFNVCQDESPRDTTLQVDLYELYAIVYVIKQECKGDSHLVSCVNVREPYHQRKEGVTCSQWYLVNDFLFKPVDKVSCCEFCSLMSLMSFCYQIVEFAMETIHPSSDGIFRLTPKMYFGNTNVFLAL